MKPEALAKALHGLMCQSRSIDGLCGDHWRTQLDTARAVLAADDPGRELHERICWWGWQQYSVPTRPGCPDPGKHTEAYRRWLASLAEPDLLTVTP